MHYKNGREAHSGEPIVTIGYNERMVTGIIHDLVPGSDSCNGMIQRVLGQPLSVTVGQCYHVEDALAAIEATMPSNSPALPGPHAVVEPPNPATPKTA